MAELYTIGFTQKSAKEFFELLKKNHITFVADVRLNNTGQLAGFSKKQDLEYFLSLIAIEYGHWKLFAPTKEIRKKYHTNWDWDEYVKSYIQILSDRKAIKHLDKTVFQHKKICLLCSEPSAEKCHRRIAAELISKEIANLEIVHL